MSYVFWSYLILLEYTEVTDELDELFRRLMKKHLPHVKIEDELNNHHFSGKSFA